LSKLLQIRWVKERSASWVSVASLWTFITTRRV